MDPVVTKVYLHAAIYYEVSPAVSYCFHVSVLGVCVISGALFASFLHRHTTFTIAVPVPYACSIEK
jgi:hypothetical protein